jgi:replication initiation protein RepC
MTIMTQISAPQGSGHVKAGRGQQVPHTPDPRFVILRNVVTCREALRLNKGDVSALRALLYCLHNGDNTLVFASNDTLSRHADGMAVRTLSRHIGRLVDAGLAVRRDSPTKRRYARRANGAVISGYGIDLAPLFDQADQIAILASDVTEDAARLIALQDHMSCLANQLAADNIAPALVEEARKERRRKADPDRIAAMINALQDALPPVSQTAVADILATGDSQNGRPDQKAILEEESDRPQIQMSSACELNLVKVQRYDDQDQDAVQQAPRKQVIEDVMHPADVLHLCPEAASFCEERPMRSWHDLAAFAWDLAGWMNIDKSTVRDAAERLGIAAASATIMAICQCGSRVRSPGAYLRKLGRTANFNAATFLRRLSPGNLVRGRHA